MKAAILSMGDELVLGQIQERNAGWLSARLASDGVLVTEHRTVADELPAIVEALKSLASSHEIVMTTGGLGPTDDDLLRPALAQVLGGAALVEDVDARAGIERWFAGRGRSMPAINLRQAMRPPSARCLTNDHGTAPGLAASLDLCRIWCLPGPPTEMQPMFERFVAPALVDNPERRRLRIESIPVLGIGESSVAERLGELMHRDRNPLIGTTASGSVVTVRVRAHGAAATDAIAFDALIDEIVQRVAPYALGVGHCTIPEALARECTQRGATLAIAESCTGGLAAAMCCDVPGASAWFRGGAVTYADDLKSTLLDVPRETIERHGAVSAETALAMAEGTLARFSASAALAITGVAGPDGGSAAKPIGTVWIATVLRAVGPTIPDERRVRLRHFRLPGDRAAVRDRAARMALGAMRLHLRGEDEVPLPWEQPRNA